MRHAVNLVLGPISAFLKDWAVWFPEHCRLLGDVENDIGNRTKTRGFRFVAVDLPDLGKIYDKALNTGFPWDELDFRIYGKRSTWGTDYNILDIIRLTFDEAGTIKPSEDFERLVFFTRTLLYFYKKTTRECNEDSITQTLRDFRRTDENLRSPDLDWVGDSFDVSGFCRSRLSFQSAFPNPDKGLGERLDQVSGILISKLGRVRLEDLAPRNGPGAVAEGGRYRDKYIFPNWPAKLERVFPFDWFASHNLSIHDYRNHEPPSRILAVPKTFKGPRIITAEPHAHQYCQQAVNRWLRDRIRPIFKNAIRLDSQEPSREAARVASLLGDFATVDLSEASDRLSCWTIERLFASNLSVLEHLVATRSRWGFYEAPNGEKSYLLLSKYAGMGNATTFPVQSIAYAIICVAVILDVQNLRPTPRRVEKALDLVQVFGDDIVVPSVAVTRLSEALSLLQLKVNESKTHSTGHFRESCGFDAYRGTDVTPFYFRGMDMDSPDDVVSYVEVSNNAYRKGLWHLSDWMRRALIKRLPRYDEWGRVEKFTRKGWVPDHPIPLHIPVTNNESFSIRFHTFQTSSPKEVKSRWSADIHSVAYRVTTAHERRESVDRSSEANLLQYFVEEPDPTKSWSAGWVKKSRVSLRVRWVTPYGVGGA